MLGFVGAGRPVRHDASGDRLVASSEAEVR
jgi:hypothetical protein